MDRLLLYKRSLQAHALLYTKARISICNRRSGRPSWQNPSDSHFLEVQYPSARYIACLQMLCAALGSLCCPWVHSARLQSRNTSAKAPLDLSSHRHNTCNQSTMIHRRASQNGIPSVVCVIVDLICLSEPILRVDQIRGNQICLDVDRSEIGYS